jgi:hypothetical protein
LQRIGHLASSIILRKKWSSSQSSMLARGKLETLRVLTRLQK